MRLALPLRLAVALLTRRGIVTAMPAAAAMLLAGVRSGRSIGGRCRLIGRGRGGAVGGRLRGGIGRLVIAMPAAAAAALTFARPALAGRTAWPPHLDHLGF